MVPEIDGFESDLQRSLQTIEPEPLDSTAIEQMAERAGDRRRRRRRLTGGVLALGLLVAAVLALAPGDEPLGPPTVSATSSVTLPGTVLDTATGAGALWILTCSGGCGGPKDAPVGEGDLVKVNETTGTIELSTPVVDPHAIASSGDSVWMTSPIEGTVSRFDADTGHLEARIPLTLPDSQGGEVDFLPGDVAAAQDEAWVSSGRGFVAQIKSGLDEPSRVITTLPILTEEVVLAGGSAWVAARLEGVLRFDTGSGSRSDGGPIEDSRGRRLSVSALSADGVHVWATGVWAEPAGNGYVATDEKVVAELDPGTGEPLSFTSVPEGVSIRATTGSDLWIGDLDSRDVYRLEAGSETADLAAKLAEPGTIVAATGESLWVARPHRTLEKYEVGS